MAGQGLVQQLVWTVPLWLGAPVLAQSATVVSIGDGDSLRVRLGGEVRSVRLACIDAPERAQIPWGQQARAQHHQRSLRPTGGPAEPWGAPAAG
jgi:micrococcal nuclease